MIKKTLLLIFITLSGLALVACGSSSGGGGNGKTAPEAPFTEEIQKIVAPDAQAGDKFGRSIAISSDYAIVGAINEDGGAGDPLNNTGSAYIFYRTGTNSWDIGTKIMAPDAQAADHFGKSVDIDGDYVIIGADSEDDGGLDAGAAYIFHRTGTNSWDNGTKITASDAQADDRIGRSVAISGDYAIVGAPTEDGGPGDPLQNVGAAYIFKRTGTNSWDGGTKIMAPDAQAYDWFGRSVDIDGDYIIVGATWEDGGAGDPLPGAGAAYIFNRDPSTGTWDSGTKIVATDSQANDHFGSVAISGDYVIVGAREEDGGAGNPLNNTGAAYIFHRTGTNSWDSGTKIMAPDAQADDEFDIVDIYGDYAIVGALFEDGGAGDPLPDAGAAYIFHRTGTNSWDSGTKIMASDSQAGDGFGHVSINGDYAIVGAPTEDGGPGDPLSNAGAAYIFR